MEHKFIKSKDFAASVKNTAFLYGNFWKEGTTSLLHASRETDKTAKALEIATKIAESGRPLLYINAEDRLGDHIVPESDNLFIFTPEFESIDDTTDYADLVFGAIEQAVRTTDIRTFVIDSVTRIAALSFGRNASVAYIMKRLVALQVKCRLSLLVVADDATKSTARALMSLAASEITISDDDSPTLKIQAVASDKSESVHQELTRQQRRALERRMKKHPERYDLCALS